MKDETKTHPSYGLLGFSRVTCGGGGQAMFGSDLTHNTFIKMTLYHAEQSRGLSRNWYHPCKPIAEVNMSQNQFSELITSMNMGSGIPVTLQFTEKDGLIRQDACENVRKLHETEFRDTARQIADSAFQLQERIREMACRSSPVKKADREVLLSHAEAVVRDLVANMPYMEKCFKEAMDDVVTDAKGSIEAFYQHRVVESGLAAIQDGAVKPKLIGEDDHL